MGKDPTKPRGKMSSYAYFVQTCREEHKKKHPEASVNFSEFSKKCSERWKVRKEMSDYGCGIILKLSVTVKKTIRKIMKHHPRESWG